MSGGGGNVDEPAPTFEVDTRPVGAAKRWRKIATYTDKAAADRAAIELARLPNTGGVRIVEVKTEGKAP